MIINEDFFKDINDTDVDNSEDVSVEKKPTEFTHYMSINTVFGENDEDVCWKIAKTMKWFCYVLDNLHMIQNYIADIQIMFINSKNNVQRLSDIIKDISDKSPSELSQCVSKHIKKSKLSIGCIFEVKFNVNQIPFDIFVNDFCKLYSGFIMKSEYISDYNPIMTSTSNYFYISNKKTGQSQHLKAEKTKLPQLDTISITYGVIYDVNTFKNKPYDNDFKEWFNDTYDYTRLSIIQYMKKMAKNPGMFKEYDVEVLGFKNDAIGRYLCFKILPKSEQYNETGKLIDFADRRIRQAICDFDYSEVSHDSSQLFKIFVLTDFQNMKPTESSRFGKNKFYGYYLNKKYNVGVSIRLVDLDWHLIDTDGTVMSWHALLENDIKSMQETWRRVMHEKD